MRSLILVLLVTFIANTTSHTIDDVYKGVQGTFERILQFEQRLRRIENAVSDVVDNVDANTELLKKVDHRLNTMEGALEKQGDSLGAQGEILKKQEKTLNIQGASLRAQGETLRAQGNVLTKVEETLEAQGRTLRKQGESLDKQGETLRTQGETLRTQGNVLTKVEETLDRQGRSLSKHGKSLEKQGETLKIQESVLLDVNETLITQEKSLEIAKIAINDIETFLKQVPVGKTDSAPAESCSWIDEHHYNLKSGKYWLKKDGKSSFEYCKMNEAGVPPAVPTTVAPTSTPVATTEPPTTKPAPLVASCKELKEQQPHLKSGLHQLTINGKKFEAYCDMVVDGGGWIMVGNAVAHKVEDAEQLVWRRIQSDNYSELANVTSGRYLLSTKGLNALYNRQPFTEIRFDCYKDYHNRRVHLKATSRAVLQYLLGRSPGYPPRARGTYKRLPGDTSYLASHMEQLSGSSWYLDNIYYCPIFVRDQNRRSHSISLKGNYQLWCDDCRPSPLHPHYSDVGKWFWYVR